MSAVAATRQTVESQTRKPPLRLLFALPGLHRVVRGAEVAFESLGAALAERGCEVTLVGSGEPRPDRPYRFLHAGCTPRERFMSWPRVPVFRSHYAYEDATFASQLWHVYRPGEYDATVTCNYPFSNWALRVRGGRRRPAHIFVTQNGDWPARAGNREYRFFGCDGLVCTNPEFFEANRARWRCALIPNGVDTARFTPGPSDRARFGLSNGAPVVLIASALIPSKRVLEGIRAVSGLPDVQLLVLGDGELRDAVDREGRERLRARFRRATVSFGEMPAAYRSADVLLHMSRDEPFGNIYIEAMACGLPVVAHDRPSTRWMLEDQAVLVDTADEGAVREAIRAAIEQRSGAAAAARRAHVEQRFTWPVIAGQFETFVSEVCADRSRRGAA